jgi:hypothetical protein
MKDITNEIVEVIKKKKYHKKIFFYFDLKYIKTLKRMRKFFFSVLLNKI